jgi:hypothetical protein
MNVRATIAILALTAAGSSAAYAGCTEPPDNVTVPDGSTATKQQLLAAHSAFVAYDAKVKAYVDCLNKEESQEVASAGKDLKADEKKKIDVRYQGKRDAAVDEEQKVATRLNTQINAFNAKAKGK